jgi:hypothetical protein
MARDTPMILYEAGAVLAGWAVEVELELDVSVAVEEVEDMMRGGRRFAGWVRFQQELQKLLRVEGS